MLNRNGDAQFKQSLLQHSHQCICQMEEKAQFSVLCFIKNSILNPAG